MDWLTFIVEIAKALGWPVAAVVVALSFRQQINALLGRMKKGKFGPAEFEFEEAVRVLEQNFPGTPSDEIALPGVLNTRNSAAVDPRTTILEAWLKVEDAARRLGRKHAALDDQHPNDIGLVVRKLRIAGKIDWEHEKLYRQLSLLRNSAVHENDFQPLADSVVGYVSLSESLQKHFLALAGEA